MKMYSVGIVVAAFAGLAASAHAQFTLSSVLPEEPTVRYFQADGKTGRIGVVNQDWQLGIWRGVQSGVSNTSSGGFDPDVDYVIDNSFNRNATQADTRGYAWQNGVFVPFAVSYDQGTGDFSLTIDGRNTTWADSGNTGLDINALSISAVARQRVGVATFLRDMQLTSDAGDFAVGNFMAMTLTGSTVFENLYLLSGQSLGSFTLAGEVALAWNPADVPTSLAAAQFQVGALRIIPAPGAFALLGLGGLAAARRRRA